MVVFQLYGDCDWLRDWLPWLCFSCMGTETGYHGYGSVIGDCDWLPSWLYFSCMGTETGYHGYGSVIGDCVWLPWLCFGYIGTVTSYHGYVLVIEESMWLVTMVMVHICEDWLVTMVMFQLYGEYAERFELSECKLAIVHCAGHHDPSLVESLWQEILTAGKMVSGSCSGWLWVYYFLKISFELWKITCKNEYALHCISKN